MRRSGFFSLAGALSLAAASSLAVSPVVHGQTINDMPEFREVQALIQENLPGIKPEELDRAAARGLAMALSPRVLLMTNNGTSSAAGTNESGPLVLKSNVFDGPIAYVRIGRVGDKLAEEIRAACRDLGKTNK